MEHWKNQNSNYAVAQPGSMGAGKAALVLGALDGRPTKFDYDVLRTILMGGFNPDYLSFADHFVGGALRSEWATDASDGASISVNSQQGGVIRFTTDADDNDHATLALGLNWKPSDGWVFFEAAVKSVTAITVRAIEVGISDALSETNGLAFSDHSVDNVTNVATDAAIFGYDTDASMTTWAANTVKAGTPAATDLGVAPSTSEFQRLGLLVTESGDVTFYIDGTPLVTHEAAITATGLYTTWISLKSLSAAAKSIDVDYVMIVGHR